ncbi:MAG: DUF3631 domain-containing protein [Candidatus Acidiferrales bacterium]
MKRRTREEPIERFLFQRVQPESRKLRERMGAWAARQQETVKTAYADSPDLEFLGDRDAEAWTPLFAIFAVADPGSLAELRESAVVLSGQKQESAESESLAVRVLLDSESVLRDGEQHVASADLLSRLKGIEESPCCAQEFDARRLARVLSTFGIHTKTIRAGDATPRGYVVAHIRENACRYRSAPSATNATSRQSKDLGISNVADVAEQESSSGPKGGANE